MTSWCLSANLNTDIVLWPVLPAVSFVTVPKCFWKPEEQKLGLDCWVTLGGRFRAGSTDQGRGLVSHF